VAINQFEGFDDFTAKAQIVPMSASFSRQQGQGPYTRKKRPTIIPVSEKFQPQMNRMDTDTDENGWDRVESVTRTLAD
jgi:hypothetical protein